MKGSAVFFDAVGGEGRILRDGDREADAVPLSKLGAPVEKAFRLRLVLAAGYFIKAVDEDVRDVEVAAVQAGHEALQKLKAVDAVIPGVDQPHAVVHVVRRSLPFSSRPGCRFPAARAVLIAFISSFVFPEPLSPKITFTIAVKSSFKAG